MRTLSRGCASDDDAGADVNEASFVVVEDDAGMGVDGTWDVEMGWKAGFIAGLKPELSLTVMSLTLASAEQRFCPAPLLPRVFHLTGPVRWTGQIR